VCVGATAHCLQTIKRIGILVRHQMGDWKVERKADIQKRVRMYDTQCNVERKNVRKNIFITDENERRIQNTRALFLQGSVPIDVQYTTITNMFIELGHRIFFTPWNQPSVSISSSDLRTAIAKYIFDAKLTDEGISDQMADLLSRRLWEQWQQAQKVQAKYAPKE